MKIRKLSALLLVLCMLTAMFAGCGSSDSSTETTSDSAEEETAEEAVEEEEAAAEETEEEAEEEEAEAAADEAEAEEAAEETAEESAEEAEEAAEDEAEDEAETIAGSAAIEALNNGEIDQSVTLPLTEDAVTLTYWCPTNFSSTTEISSWSENYGLIYAQEQTGITLEFVECNQTVATEKFNLMVASNDLCDIIVGFENYYSAGSDSAIEEDLIIDLLDYIDYAPVYKQLLEADPDWAEYQSTEAGHIASFKTLYTKTSWIGQGIAIRKDWLDDLGMDLPVTYDEYYEVLMAFKTEYDPTYTLDIGSSLGNSWFEGGFGISVSASGSASTADFYVEDDVVYAGYTSDRFYEYVSMLHDWYEDGLISQDYITIGDLEFFENDYSALIAAGEFGCVMGAGGLLGSYADMSDDEDFEFTPGYTPRSSEDETLCYLTPASYTGTSDSPSIALQCENIELAMAFLDYFYTEEGTELANYGLEGVSFEYDENGEPQLSEMITSSGDVSSALTPYRVNIATISDPNAQTRAMMTDAACEIMQFWTDDQDELMACGNNAYYPSDVTLSAEESEDASAILSDIATYVSEAIPGFIMGTKSLDEWDAYCEALENMNLAEATAIYQDAYDRYIGAE